MPNISSTYPSCLLYIYVASSTIKEVEHFSLFVFEIVSVHLKFPLHLQPLAFKSGISSIR